MKLGGMFGQPRTLAKKPAAKKEKPSKGLVETVKTQQLRKEKPGVFNITWPKLRNQNVKDYQPILTLKELEVYLARCEETGLAGFDWETAASEEARARYEPELKRLFDLSMQAVADGKDKAEIKQLEDDHTNLYEKYKRTPLDPWQADICTASLSAAADEARVIPISHKVGRVFEPDLPRDEARQLVMDTLERLLFRNEKIVKIAVNLVFEAKYAAKYGKYIGMPAADPLVMWVRCMQIVAPQKIKDPKRPSSGKGLKPMTKNIFGVQMGDFTQLLEDHGVNFFDEIAADDGIGLGYSAEDSDYAVQHYQYWLQIAKQIPDYYDWLHNVEMPFMRVIGLMEYWGVPWDKNLADTKKEEAHIRQEQAAETIKKIVLESTGIEVNPGKTGKTNEVKSIIFDTMKLPVAKYGKRKKDGTTDPSLDKEAVIDMRFMLENKLLDLKEEKYLAADLPAGWETIDLADLKQTGHLQKDELGAIRIAQREEHPYKEPGLALLDQLKKIQSYTTLLSAHIEGRDKYQNPVSGRIHAGYTTWTETSRLNSFHPNGQNVPGTHKDEFGIRAFYTAGPGKILLFIDFSGFELRIMAWQSGDQVMIDLFNNDGDMHRRTASTMTDKEEAEVTSQERKDAKPANFGIAYGGSEYSLQTTYKTDFEIRKTLDECEKMISAVKQTYPGVPLWQRETGLKARETGYAVTGYGYKRLLPGINSTNRYDRQAAERQAMNTPVQGTAADFMKKAQNTVYDELGKADGVLQHGKHDMIMQIHDEIGFQIVDDPAELTKAEAFISKVMTAKPTADFPIPVEVEAEVGYNWRDKMSIEDYLEKRGAK